MCGAPAARLGQEGLQTAPWELRPSSCHARLQELKAQDSSRGGALGGCGSASLENGNEDLKCKLKSPFPEGWVVFDSTCPIALF